jgi:thioesterase domain-containing protein/NAD(P)-dependent dehydrogenase (short-subunit alcohol dehydrogenase family)/aryl carrier-like protein
MVFLDRTGLGKEIVSKLEDAGHRVISITPGETYSSVSDEEYTIRPGVREDYDALFTDLEKCRISPQKFIHLWSVRGEAPVPSLDEALDLSFYSLLFLAQVLGDQDPTKLDIAIVSDRLQSISGEPIADPVRATLLGPAKVVVREFPGIGCRAIDVNLGAGGVEKAATQVIAELSASPVETVVAYRGSERWTEDFERVNVQPNLSAGRLKDRGVYLITGGLGGIGLVIAEYLARNYHAKLVLLGRSSIPVAEEWKEALQSSHTPDRLKQTLRKLLEIQALGAEILTCRADVTRVDEMRQAIDLATQKFGAINGVIHAAGIAEDSPLLVKTRESAARVLDPKIKGTLVLAELLHDMQLDFVAMFSSVSSLSPPAGQVDYAAANAFLDAFAATWRGAPTIAINWGRWRGVGLAEMPMNFPHPLLNQRILNTSDEVIYASQFSCSTQWLLDEHRFKAGDALVPGTGYIEMAIGAFGALDDGVELREIFFLAPFAVAPDETREVRLKMKKKEDTLFRFSILSDEAGGLEHATGEISRSVSRPPKKYDLALLRSRCNKREISFGKEQWTRQAKYIEFGSRWSSLEKIHLGDGEGLALLKLPAEHRSDLQSYIVHPALFDLASGAALYLLENYDSSDSLYLPFSYRRVSVYKRLPALICSYMRSRKLNTSADEIVTFDVTIMDEEGVPLIDIEEFSLRRISAPSQISEGRSRARDHQSSRLAAKDQVEDTETISPSKGAEAFGQILSSAMIGGIAVSPVALKAFTHPNVARSVAPSTRNEMSHGTATSDDSVEAQLLSIWEDLLGVRPIRLQDNFFDLGGHSLLAARLSARVKKLWGTSLPIATLFEAPTIEKMATLLRGTIPKGSPRVAAIKPSGHLPPFLCVDAGPYLRFLAKRLSPDQPFLGLRLADTDNLPTHFTMADIAAYHIETIRSIQPQGPYYLGGWSASGLVAYEIAQQLRDMRQEVGLLVLFDVLNSSANPTSSKWGAVRKQFNFLKFHFAQLRNLNEHDRMTSLKSLYRRIRLDLSRMAWVIGDKIQRRATHRLALAPREPGKAVFVAAREYNPKPYAGQVLLFRSTIQSKGSELDPTLGWGNLLDGGFEIREIPGDHNDMFREPYVELLATELDRALLEARGEQGRCCLETAVS